MPAGACLNASLRVAAALSHGPHLHCLGGRQGQIHEIFTVTFVKPSASKVSTALIKQHSVVVRTTLLNHAGIIPSNGPVESWITVTLIVLPRSLARVKLQHALTQENRKLLSLSPGGFWSGCTCSASPWNLCQKHTPTACQTPLLSPWNAQLVCSQEHCGAEHSVPVDHLQELGVFKSRATLSTSQSENIVCGLPVAGWPVKWLHLQLRAQIGQLTASYCWI